VQELTARFVTVADEVGRLQRGKDAESAMFRSFCEEGHYGGRSRPTGTRQGIYAVAPSGRFLASINTTQPQRMVKMLETALARWAELAPTERALPPDMRERLLGAERFEDRYPDDGLVLAEYCRDLEPAGAEIPQWQAGAWNEDQAWFTAAEASRFVPEELAVGASRDVPARLASRLARLHLLDVVRGQTAAFRKNHVERAELRSVITGVTDGRVELRLTGHTATRHRGRWRVRDGRSYTEPVEHERGVRTELRGRATWDPAERRFTAFELVALGERWGATQYNGRPNDLEPTPIGFAFVLAPPDHPRVAPAFYWHYTLRSE